MGNGLSRDRKIPQLLQEAGDLLAEPVEVGFCMFNDRCRGYAYMGEAEE